MFTTDAGITTCLRFVLFANAFSLIPVVGLWITAFSTLPMLDIACRGIPATLPETITFFVFCRFQKAYVSMFCTVSGIA